MRVSQSPEGATTSTIESKTNFFRAVRDGRTIIVVQTDLHDANGKRVAQVTQTQAVIASA